MRHRDQYLLELAAVSRAGLNAHGRFCPWMKDVAWFHRFLQDMAETFKKALVLLFLLISAAIHAAAELDLKLIPQPKTIQPAAGDCPLGSALDIVIEDPVLKNEADVLAEDLAPPPRPP
jgi:hypothetical protein